MVRWFSQVSVNIQGIEGMTYGNIIEEINHGGRFVNFYYCFSILILTFKRPTNIYFLHAGESAFMKGLGPTLVSLIFGWWGFPFGIIYTIQSLIYNLGKDKNRTNDLLSNFVYNLSDK